jgi:transcriptional regulator with XRE-family HTH domain
MAKNNKEMINFGGRIKKIRLGMGMRLADLAEKSGYSISFLSQIENDKISPSIETLYRLSGILERPIGYFFEDTENHGAFVVRKKERKRMTLEGGDIEFELLSSNLQKKSMEALVIKIKKDHLSPEKIHNGEEVGLVIKGKINVRLDGVDHILDEGDSIYFSSSIPHSIKNIGDSESILFWVMTPPNF